MRLEECVQLVHEAGLSPKDVVLAQGTAMTAWYGFRDPTDTDVLARRDTHEALVRSGDFYPRLETPPDGAWSRFDFVSVYPYNHETGEVDTRLQIGSVGVEPYGTEIPGEEDLFDRAVPFPVPGFPTYDVISRDDVRVLKMFGRRIKDDDDLEKMREVEKLVENIVALDAHKPLRFNEYPINVVGRPTTDGQKNKLSSALPDRLQVDKAGIVHLPRRKTVYSYPTHRRTNIVGK